MDDSELIQAILDGPNAEEDFRKVPTITLKRWLSSGAFDIPDLDEPGTINHDYNVMIEDEIDRRAEQN